VQANRSSRSKAISSRNSLRSRPTPERPPPAARLWYWKQSLKTSTHLVWTSLRTAPWLIACTTLAGFAILRYAQDVANLPTRLVCAIIDRDSSFYMNHFSSWQFSLNYGLPAVNWIFAVLIGCLIAAAAKGREVVATAIFGVFELLVAPILAFLLLVVVEQMILGHHLIFSDSVYIRLGVADIYHYGGLGGLLLYFTQPLTTVLLPVIGGTIIRKIRSLAAQPRPAATN
jgi:hypothetical protein